MQPQGSGAESLPDQRMLDDPPSEPQSERQYAAPVWGEGGGVVNGGSSRVPAPTRDTSGDALPIRRDAVAAQWPQTSQRAQACPRRADQSDVALTVPRAAALSPSPTGRSPRRAAPAAAAAVNSPFTGTGDDSAPMFDGAPGAMSCGDSALRACQPGHAKGNLSMGSGPTRSSFGWIADLPQRLVSAISAMIPRGIGHRAPSNSTSAEYGRVAAAAAAANAAAAAAPATATASPLQALAHAPDARARGGGVKWQALDRPPRAAAAAAAAAAPATASPLQALAHAPDARARGGGGDKMQALDRPPRAAAAAAAAAAPATASPLQALAHAPDAPRPAIAAGATLCRGHHCVVSDDKKRGCGRCFRSAQELASHLKSQKPCLSHKFACPNCNRRFATADSLSKHQEDAKATPSACAKCPGLAPPAVRATLQLSQNAREPCHHCPVCNMCFDTPRGLERHSKRKQVCRAGLYSCNVCFKNWAQESTWRSHDSSTCKACPKLAVDEVDRARDAATRKQHQREKLRVSAADNFRTVEEAVKAGKARRETGERLRRHLQSLDEGDGSGSDGEGTDHVVEALLCEAPSAEATAARRAQIRQMSPDELNRSLPEHVRVHTDGLDRYFDNVESGRLPTPAAERSAAVRPSDPGDRALEDSIEHFKQLAIRDEQELGWKHFLAQADCAYRKAKSGPIPQAEIPKLRALYDAQLGVADSINTQRMAGAHTMACLRRRQTTRARGDAEGLILTAATATTASGERESVGPSSSSADSVAAPAGDPWANSNLPKPPELLAAQRRSYTYEHPHAAPVWADGVSSRVPAPTRDTSGDAVPIRRDTTAAPWPQTSQRTQDRPRRADQSDVIAALTVLRAAALSPAGRGGIVDEVGPDVAVFSRPQTVLDLVEAGDQARPF